MLTTTTGKGVPPEQGRPKEAGWSLRVHSLRLLLNFLPLLLVEFRRVPWSRHPAAVLPMVDRLSRREDGRAQGQARELHEPVPLPHHPQLHACLPQGFEPRQGHCRDQEADVHGGIKKVLGYNWWRILSACIGS